MTGLVVDARFEEHDTGPGHPERPARLANVRRAIEEGGYLERCSPLPTVAANDEQLTRVHAADYVKRVTAACESGQGISSSYL